MFEKLFSPIKIKDMELKNRIILPAMGTKFSGDGSEVTDKLIDYHVARVKGGSGLNIVEVTSVYTPAAPKRFLSLSEDEYIPGMKRLTDAIHAEGGKAGVQLWLGALAVSSDRAAQIIIPSDMPISAEITIPGMPKELIPVVVDAYGKAVHLPFCGRNDGIDRMTLFDFVYHILQYFFDILCGVRLRQIVKCPDGKAFLHVFRIIAHEHEQGITVDGGTQDACGIQTV